MCVHHRRFLEFHPDRVPENTLASQARLKLDQTQADATTQKLMIVENTNEDKNVLLVLLRRIVLH